MLDRRRVELAIIALVGAVVVIAFLATERGFPDWDFAAYHNRTLDTADAFRVSLSSGLRLIRRSLQEDYNRLFAVPLVPWSILFGESRQVFILSVYVTYFLPFLVLVSTIAGRSFPGEPDYARRVTAVAVLLTPVCWYHVVQGFPDIGGAGLLASCVLVYGRRATAYSPWPSALLIAVLAAAAIAFRRPYVFGVAALFGAMLIDDTWYVFRRTGDSSARYAFGRIGSTVCSGAIMALLVALAAPGVVRRALHRGDQFVPYELSVGETLQELVGSVGTVPLILATLGWVSLARLGHLRRAELRLILLATLLWVGLWAAVSRHLPYHYPHWVPMAVALGAAGLWVSVGNLFQRGFSRSVRGGMVLAGALAWMLCVPVPDLGVTRQMPLRLFPDPLQQNINPAYDAIVELTGYLREVASPDDPILVAASSRTLNRFTLRSAEQIRFGRRNAFLRILEPPELDSDDAVPTNFLLRAALVIVAEPFQHHMQPQFQKSVRVLVDAFTGGWPISRDFVQLPHVFPLPDGGQVRVFQRHRPTSLDSALDASRRVNAFVLGRAREDELWVTDSPYSSDVSRDDDGSVRIRIHPATASSARQSVARLAAAPRASIRLTGALEFYDSRCVGVEIVAIVGVDGARPAYPLLAATPSSRGASIDTVVRLDGEPLTLGVRSLRTSPERIEYCTVNLKALRVRAVP
jgi:hypothetical protein